MSFFPKRNKGPKSERSKALAKADRAFSEYIRLRDCPGRCPTTGQFITYDTSDCGHYISRAKLAVRFDEINAHAQSRFANRFRQGMSLEYRVWMVEKYGESRVQELERLALMQGSKFTAFDFELIAQKYKAKAKELAYKKPAKN